MLTTNQIADLDSTKLDIENKKLILKTAIDIQALLRIMIDKEIITRNEVSQYREEVGQSSKYKTAMLYVEQSLEEIKKYQENPELRLKEMFKRKKQGQ